MKHTSILYNRLNGKLFIVYTCLIVLKSRTRFSTKTVDKNQEVL